MSDDPVLPEYTWPMEDGETCFREIDEFAKPDAQHIAVDEDPLADRNAVDEGAIVAFQVGELGVIVGPLDDTVLAGDGGVGWRNGVRSVAPDRHTTAIEVELLPFERDRKSRRCGDPYWLREISLA